MVSKIYLTLSALPKMYLCKYGQNPSTVSEDNAQKRSYVGAEKIHTKKQYEKKKVLIFSENYYQFF